MGPFGTILRGRATDFKFTGVFRTRGFTLKALLN